MENKISLSEVVNVKQWQEIQDHFAQVLGVTIRTVGANDNLYTKPSKPTRLCEEVIRSTPEGVARCRKCHPPSVAELKTREGWKEGYLCYIGLHNFAIPVTLPDGEAIAYIIAGPILLGGRQKPGIYREKIAELNIDLDKFIDALIEIKVFSFSGVQSALELLQDVITYIVEMGYLKLKLQRMIPFSKLSKMSYKFYTERLLNALLDVSFNVTNAQFGSVMLLDEKNDELYIKIGRGIDQDIVKNARLKMGEGIAGLAAQERRFLLVDDKVKDARIRNRLKRPEIKSAIIAPIQVKDELFGVMNIGTLRPSDKFNLKNVDALRQLVQLVTVTFEDMFEEGPYLSI